MAGPKSTVASSLLVPRFVRSLNAMAAKCGLSVSVTSGTGHSWPHRNGGEPIVVAVWRGSQDQIRATGQLTPGYRFPYNGGQGVFRSALACGRVFKEGRMWCAEIDCGPIPARIEIRGAVEVIHYETETAYYGTREALIDAKICTQKKNFPSDKRVNCSGGGYMAGRRWKTRRLHDGTYAHSIENEDVFKARLEEEQRPREYARVGHISQSPRREPETAEEFRSSTEESAKILMYHLHGLAGRDRGNVPFCFDDEALDAMLHAFRDIWSVIQDGKIVRLRSPIDPERMRAVKAAESDPTFQRFLGKLHLGQRPAG